jgi:hypothetical protein
MAENSGKASNATPLSIFKYIQIPFIDSQTLYYDIQMLRYDTEMLFIRIQIQLSYISRHKNIRKYSKALNALNSLKCDPLI